MGGLFLWPLSAYDPQKGQGEMSLFERITLTLPLFLKVMVQLFLPRTFLLVACSCPFILLSFCYVYFVHT